MLVFFSPASFLFVVTSFLFGWPHKHKKQKKTRTQTNKQTKNQYDLTLVASDSLNESVTRVVILIKDSNDLPPIFNQTMYTAHALEELADPLPFKLLQVASTSTLRI